MFTETFPALLMDRWERISRAVLTAGIVAILLSPLVVAKGLDLPFFIGKILLFRLAVDLTLAPTAFLLWRAGWRRILFHPIVLCWGLLLAVRIIAALAGVDPFQSFWSDLDRSEGLWTEIHVWLFLVELAVALASGVRVRPVLAVSVGGALAVLAMAILLEKAKLSLLGELSQRSSGTIGNPAFLAEYLIFQAFFAFLLAALSKSRRWRMLCLLVGAILSVGVLATQTRAAAFPFLLALFLLGAWLASGRLVSMKRRGRILALGLAGAVVAAVIMAAPSVPARFSRLTEISLSDTSLVNRFFVWKIFGEAVLERPLLGWGPENQLAAYYGHYDPAVRRLVTEVYDRAHNMILDAAVTGGILGLSATVALHTAIASALIRGLRRRRGSERTADAVLLAAEAAFIASNLFLFEMITTWVPLVLLASIATARSLTPRETEGLARGRPILAVVGAAGALFLFVSVINPARALGLEAAARNTYDENLPLSLSYYRRALDLRSFIDRETAKDLSLRLIKEGESPGGPKDRQVWLEGVALAEEAIGREMKRHPWDISFANFLARLEDLRAAQDPARPSAALRVFEEAHRRYPELVDLCWNLALRSIQAGQVDSGLRLLEETAGASPSFGFEPEWGEGYLFAGLGYAIAGRNEDALVALRMAESLNPGLAGQAEAARKRIRKSKNTPVFAEETLECSQ